MTAEQFLSASLEHVESKTIRAWVVSDHNRPLFLKMAEGALAKGKGDPLRFGTYIVCVWLDGPKGGA